MRSKEQIAHISKNFSSPRSVENFLTPAEVQELISLYKSSDTGAPLVYKNTGPVTLNINDYLDRPVFKSIWQRIEKEIGAFEMTAGFFFWTNYPHIIHNDDTFELPDTVYKGINLPLEFEGLSNIYPKLCFFDQYYFHGPAKFFNGSNSIPTYYNRQIYEYSNVSGTVNRPFVDGDKFFTHLNYKWLEGLSLQTSLDWIPGNALIFDSVQLHCASDFRQLGIKSKLGISIFTKKC